MTTQLEQNLIYLKRTRPITYELVMKALLNRKSNKYKLVINQNESYNILVSILDHSLLYSKYDPAYECYRWCESLQLDEEGNKDILLFGLGLTYHLSALMEKYPNYKFIIYEPEIELFVEMLHIVNVSLLYDHPNIKYIGVGKDEGSLLNCFEAINKYCTIEYSYVRIPFYESINIDTEKVFLENLKQISLRKKAVEGFHQTFGKIMYTNTLRNIPKLLKTPTLKTLENRFDGATALVVGGGPSLQYDIEHIKKKQDQWLIIAAGSSIQSLTHYGITPHLIVSMDAGVYNAKVFRVNSYVDIPLLVMPQIHHEILELHHVNNLYAYYDNDVMINFLIPYQDRNYIMKPTYSVTGTAIQVAAYMGAKTIVLAGQDLSYPGKQKYSPGTAHLGKSNFSRIEKELKYEVRNVKGSTNPTTFSMLQTLKDIEQLIASIQNIKFINTSKEGAVIIEAPFRAIEEIIDESIHDKNLVHDVKSILSKKSIYHKVDVQVIVSKLQDTSQYVTNLLKRISWFEKELSRLIQFSRTKPNKAVTLLKDIEEGLNQLFKEDTFVNLIREWFILELSTLERQVLDVAKEPQLIKKITMLDEILSPVLKKMSTELPSFNNEITKTRDQLILQIEVN